MTANYIFFSLCDNDFNQLQEAVDFVFNNKEVELTESEYKHFVINYLIFAGSVRRIHPQLIEPIEYYTKYRPYLERALKVTFLKDPPTYDHDGGSVVLDIHNKYSWRI